MCLVSVTVPAGGQPSRSCRCPPLLADRGGGPSARPASRRHQTESSYEAAAGLRLAWALELVVDEELDEPLEIGWPQAEAVIRAIPEVAHAYVGLEVLLQAARRLADAPP